MKTIEERIEAAWQKYRGQETYDEGYPVKASDNFIAGFKAGAAEAWRSQWISVEEFLPPFDDDVFVVLENGNNTFVGVAWCSNIANGGIRWYSNDDNLDMDLVRFWMPIPPIQ